MALSSRLIRSKIKAVGNIRKITKAMELVSASKMKRAVGNALATREYSTEALNFLVHIAGEQDADHPFLHPGPGSGALIVFIASDKGLCGSFNVNVGRTVLKYARALKGGNTSFITVGRNAERAAKKMGLPVIGSFTNLPDNLHIEDIGGLRKLVLDEFASGKYRKIFIGYMNYISAIKYQPVVRQILPVEPDIVKNMIEEVGKDAEQKSVRYRNFSRYIFEPSNSEVLSLVVPRLVESALFQALLESLASEHSARMFAMKNANDNAADILADLTLTYNHARQDAVTREITEIAAGANALGVM